MGCLHSHNRIPGSIESQFDLVLDINPNNYPPSLAKKRRERGETLCIDDIMLLSIDEIAKYATPICRRYCLNTGYIQMQLMFFIDFEYLGKKLFDIDDCGNLAFLHMKHKLGFSLYGNDFDRLFKLFYYRSCSNKKHYYSLT